MYYGFNEFLITKVIQAYYKSSNVRFECIACMHASSVTQSSPSLCDPMDCSLTGSSVHGILQARILEWVAIPSSRGSSRSRDWTCVSSISCIAGGFFTSEAPGKALEYIAFQYFSWLQGPLPTLPWFVSPPKFMWWNQMPNVMVFGGGAFGRWLGFEMEPSWMELVLL